MRFFARHKFSAARHLKLFCTPAYNNGILGLHTCTTLATGFFFIIFRLPITKLPDSGKVARFLRAFLLVVPNSGSMTLSRSKSSFFYSFVPAAQLAGPALQLSRDFWLGAIF